MCVDPIRMWEIMHKKYTICATNKNNLPRATNESDGFNEKMNLSQKRSKIVIERGVNDGRRVGPVKHLKVGGWVGLGIKRSHQVVALFTG